MNLDFSAEDFSALLRDEEFSALHRPELPRRPAR